MTLRARCSSGFVQVCFPLKSNLLEKKLPSGRRRTRKVSEVCATMYTFQINRAASAKTWTVTVQLAHLGWAQDPEFSGDTSRGWRHTDTESPSASQPVSWNQIPFPSGLRIDFPSLLLSAFSSLLCKICNQLGNRFVNSCLNLSVSSGSSQVIFHSRHASQRVDTKYRQSPHTAVFRQQGLLLPPPLLFAAGRLSVQAR